MKIDRYSDCLKIVTDDYDMQIASVTVFGQQSYAVAISGRGVWYFGTITEALDHVSEYLSISENREVLDYLRKGPKQNTIEVC
jgi:hypothetical protein